MRACHVLILLVSFLLGGCWDRNEVNDLAIVLGAAIDVTEENKIELTVQVLVTKSSSSGGMMSTGSNISTSEMTMVRVGNGINLSDAMSKIQTKVSRRLFWGHCKVYIFGEKAARRGISSEVDFLMRHPEPRMQAVIFVSKGPAREILEVRGQLLERSTVESLRELVYQHRELEMTVVDVRNRLREYTHAMVIPYLNQGSEWRQPDPRKENNPVIGLAVFRQDRMIGTLSMDEKEGMMWLVNKQATPFITAKNLDHELGSITIQPLTNHVRLIPHVKQGTLQMQVSVVIEGLLLENNSTLNPVDLNDLRAMEEILQEHVKNQLQATMKALQKKWRADAVGFGLALYRIDPKEWRKRKSNWEENFAKIDVRYKVELSIRRPGISKESAKKTGEG